MLPAPQLAETTAEAEISASFGFRLEDILIIHFSTHVLKSSGCVSVDF